MIDRRTDTPAPARHDSGSQLLSQIMELRHDLVRQLADSKKRARQRRVYRAAVLQFWGLVMITSAVLLWIGYQIGLRA